MHCVDWRTTFLLYELLQVSPCPAWLMLARLAQVWATSSSSMAIQAAARGEMELMETFYGYECLRGPGPSQKHPQEKKCHHGPS